MRRATTTPSVSKGRNACRPEPLAGRRKKRGDDSTCVDGPRSELSTRERLWARTAACSTCWRRKPAANSRRENGCGRMHRDRGAPRAQGPQRTLDERTAVGCSGDAARGREVGYPQRTLDERTAVGNRGHAPETWSRTPQRILHERTAVGREGKRPGHTPDLGPQRTLTERMAVGSHPAESRSSRANDTRTNNMTAKNLAEKAKR